MSEQENQKIQYKAALTRAQARNLFALCEHSPTKSKALLAALSAASLALTDAGKVQFDNDGWTTQPFKGDEAKEICNLLLSREAILGIKHAVCNCIRDGITLAERRIYLLACDKIGANGIFRRVVETECAPPDQKVDDFTDEDLKGMVG